MLCGKDMAFSSSTIEVLCNSYLKSSSMLDSSPEQVQTFLHEHIGSSSSSSSSSTDNDSEGSDEDLSPRLLNLNL